MRITSTMDLHQLMETMGDCATLAEARHMRATLDGIGAWERTEDVPENEWSKMLDGAVAQAKHDGPTAITYANDPLLVVFIDRTSVSAPVTFQYLAFDDAPVQATPYQTADMPADDQAAAEMVSQYADSICG